MTETTRTTTSAEETQRLARLLGEACTGGEIFLLIGPLGAGKTAFTQGLAWGLGVDEYTHSPTFVLVAEYHGKAGPNRGPLVLYHMDLYRIESIPEAIDLGLQEYLDSGGVTAIEWADKAAGVLSDVGLRVEISYVGESRRDIRFVPQDSHHEALLRAAQARWESEPAASPRGA